MPDARLGVNPISSVELSLYLLTVALWMSTAHVVGDALLGDERRAALVALCAGALVAATLLLAAAA